VTPIATLLGGVGLAALGASHAARTYLEHRREGGGGRLDGAVSKEALDRERLRAYRETMDAVIRLNRAAVEMGEAELREQADLLAHDEASELDEPHARVARTYQSYYHVVGDDVREALSEYVDYLVTFHDEGARAGDLLSRSGSVAEAMRLDIGLDPLFGTDERGDGADG
jgi:hypothetical protein